MCSGCAPSAMRGAAQLAHSWFPDPFGEVATARKLSMSLGRLPVPSSLGCEHEGVGVSLNNVGQVLTQQITHRWRNRNESVRPLAVDPQGRNEPTRKANGRRCHALGHCELSTQRPGCGHSVGDNWALPGHGSPASGRANSCRSLLTLTALLAVLWQPPVECLLTER